MGTGLIVCKAMFQSAIVLEESQMIGAQEEVEQKEEAVMHHYGGLIRKVDGGGDGAVLQKSISRRKDSIGSKKSSVSEKRMEKEESDFASNSEDDASGSSIGCKSGSDDEFVPLSKKRRKSGKGKDGDAAVPERKCTSFR